MNELFQLKSKKECTFESKINKQIQDLIKNGLEGNYQLTLTFAEFEMDFKIKINTDKAIEFKNAIYNLEDLEFLLREIKNLATNQLKIQHPNTSIISAPEFKFSLKKL